MKRDYICVQTRCANFLCVVCSIQLVIVMKLRSNLIVPCPIHIFYYSVLDSNLKSSFFTFKTIRANDTIQCLFLLHHRLRFSWKLMLLNCKIRYVRECHYILKDISNCINGNECNASWVGRLLTKNLMVVPGAGWLLDIYPPIKVESEWWLF